MQHIHLHIHSNYSFCRGANTHREICTALVKHGQRVVVFTERNGLHGLIWAQKCAGEHGLRFITGAEITDATSRAVLLAKSRTGYENLSRLLTLRHAEGTPDDLLLQQVRHFRDGLVILSDSPPLLKMLSADGPDDLYAMCIPGPTRWRMLQIAKKLHIPPVATNDVYFVSPQDFEIHKVLRAIDCNEALYRVAPQELARPDAWLKTPEEMMLSFPDAPEALENTVRIAEACTYSFQRKGDIFPRLETPTGESEAVFLRRLCMQGIKERYRINLEPTATPSKSTQTAGVNGSSTKRDDLTTRISARLEKELGIITRKGFASYFLVMWDVVRKASRTCGRGSAAASLVSYLLKITHVDPIRYNLFFERFLHDQREDPPDIDVDFAWDERDAILDYIFERYGTTYTAMIANHVTFQGRAALREVAKVLNMHDDEISKVSNRLIGHSIRDIAASIMCHPMFRGMTLDAPWPKIINLADRITGFPRNLSVHCGGIVITPKPVSHYIPIERAPKGVPIVQVEKDQAEELGLIKLDILGNRSLAVIRDAVAAVARNTGRHLNFNRINPADDAKTQHLMKTGDTIGVFYVESPAMRQLQKKVRTGKFEDLVIHSSIVRPAANEYNREYIRRRLGGAYNPIHPKLEKILEETRGIMCYQEDITRVAMALADFSAAEGDKLRKVFSKKNNEKTLAAYKVKFFEGARKNDIPKAAIQKIWGMILSFSGYSFCKPHSASYAMVSYQAAFLRAHYPAEFMAAVITNQGGYYSTFAYVSEARRMGLRVLPIDVNASERAYHGSGNQLRIGLMQLKGFPDADITRILEKRRTGGPFSNFDAFVSRTRLRPASLEILIKSGAFDNIENVKERPALLWRIFQHQTRQQALTRTEKQRDNRQTSLFDEAVQLKQAPPLPPYTTPTLLQQEREALGTLLSRHPLSLYTRFLRGRRLVAAAEMAKHTRKRISMLGWYITGKLVHTHDGKNMEFISFEDDSGLYETTFFPKVYERYCQLFIRTRPYILTGIVDEDFGVVSLTVERVEEVSPQRGVHAPGSSVPRGTAQRKNRDVA